MTDTSLRSVLLVEDSPSDARLIEEYLAESTREMDPIDPTITRVTRLEAAEEALSDQDAVLLDLDLPDSGGLETVERALAFSAKQPVVVLTGLDDERIGMAAVAEGAQDYLVKDDLTPRLLQQSLRHAVERHRQQVKLRRRNEELALLNQVVRHDIKNDLSIILGWGDALGDHVDDDGEAYLERMLDASTHIVSLVQTVGEFMEILDGHRTVDTRPIELARVLTAEVKKLRTAHENAQITASDLPNVEVRATDLLSSVFRNLLTNAVIHNDDSVPQVWVDVTTTDETVAVAIADDGPGVPDTRKADIFGRGEMGLESPGSGIGLYLVDTLVELYDGTVEVADRTEAGDVAGSVFTVRLPRA